MDYKWIQNIAVYLVVVTAMLHAVPGKDYERYIGYLYESKGYKVEYHGIKKGFEDYVFLARWGNSISRIMVFHLIKELAEKSGITKNISPHTFRHSFATHLLEGGANLRAIQCMLGHESIATTEIYTHIDRNMLRSEIIEHHPRNIKYRKEKEELFH